MTFRVVTLVPILGLAACASDYSLGRYADLARTWDWDDLLGEAGTGEGWATADCWEGFTPAGSVNIDETCIKEKAETALQPRIEWSMGTYGAYYPEFNATLMTPAVGELTDDNGDGVIDGHDMPDIVVVNDRTEGEGDNGVFRVLSGDGTRVSVTVQMLRFEDGTQYTFNRYSGVAIGDVDIDGLPEIIVTVAGRGGGSEPPPDSGPPSGGEGMDTPETGSGGTGAQPPTETGEPDDTPVGPRPATDVPPPPSGGVQGNCVAVSLTPDGDVEWIAESELMPCTGHSPAIADLEGDGDVEVVIGSLILNGEDGTVQAKGEGRGRGCYMAHAFVGYQSFPLDLDLDGVQEVIAGANLYDPSGRTLCEIDPDLEDGFPAAADLDGDGFGEYVLVGNGHMRVFEADCSMVAGWDLVGEGNGGPPVIGDFDSDGEPEIGTVNANYYQVYEPDGTLLWTHEISDWSSHSTGSALFDLEGDGRMEVVYGDETALWVFDGANGEVRLVWTDHTSRTLHEYPVVADVDADGQTELVVPNGGGHYGYNMGGISVIGSATNDWPTGRLVWNQHAYNVVNINDDLTIPRYPMQNWPTYNNFRAGTPIVGPGGRTPDAVPTEVALCLNKCRDGLVGFRLSLGNGGLSRIEAGIPVSLYGRSGKDLLYVTTAWSSRALEEGEAVELYFQAPVSWFPEGEAVFIVDDAAGTSFLNECHEDNNTVSVTGVTCD